MADPQAAAAELSKAQKAVKALLKLKVAAIFSAPVSEEEVPGYSLVIQNPMDLGTVLEKLKNGEYASAGTVHCPTKLVVSSTAIQCRRTYIHTYVYMNIKININVDVLCKYDTDAKAFVIKMLQDTALHTNKPVHVCHAGTRPSEIICFL